MWRINCVRHECWPDTVTYFVNKCVPLCFPGNQVILRDVSKIETAVLWVTFKGRSTRILSYISAELDGLKSDRIMIQT